MSDNIPIDLQLEIIKKVSNVRSLVRFRSVSKSWKSFIDSSDFITYAPRHTQPNSHILSYGIRNQDELELGYICLVDDDIQTFKVQQQQQFAPFVLSPLLKQFSVDRVVGTSHGLVCFYGFHNISKEWMIVVWNPSIGKSFRINIAPIGLSHTVYGFGVCPDTKDPTIVKIRQPHNKPWHVEVFTFTTGVWNVIPSANLPQQSIKLNRTPHVVVVVDGFIYWSAREKTINDESHYTTNPMVVSFDLITKEFNLVDIPNSLTNQLLGGSCSVSKLRESLVIYGHIWVDQASCCSVWVMERDSSFRKLFTIATPVSRILGFSKSGEPIFEIPEDLELVTLVVYNPCSQQIKKNLGISGVWGSFYIGSYKETLLLLDHSD